jgi:hypothetical protein
MHAHVQKAGVVERNRASVPMDIDVQHRHWDLKDPSQAATRTATTRGERRTSTGNLSLKASIRANSDPARAGLGPIPDQQSCEPRRRGLQIGGLGRCTRIMHSLRSLGIRLGGATKWVDNSGCGTATGRTFQSPSRDGAASTKNWMLDGRSTAGNGLRSAHQEVQVRTSLRHWH